MMKSAQEIELKFAASAEALRLMQQRLPAKTQNTKPKTLVSVYFDTANLKLHKRGLSLRVRRDGKHQLQTIKAGDGQGVVRGEWEHETTSDGPELKAARGSPAYELLAKKKVRRALKPVFETRVTRVAYPVKAGDSVVEISFDQGEIDTGRACWPISEVEFELKRGSLGDLLKLAKDFARKSPVELTLASKAERGYVFLNGEKDTPIRAAPIAVVPDMEAGAAFQAIVDRDREPNYRRRQAWPPK
jgi:inorganic triphosphatase YgiF